jgi:hypothetical protein
MKARVYDCLFCEASPLFKAAGRPFGSASRREGMPVKNKNLQILEHDRNYIHATNTGKTRV